jgi:hypothetical protein
MFTCYVVVEEGDWTGTHGEYRFPLSSSAVISLHPGTNRGPLNLYNYQLIKNDHSNALETTSSEEDRLTYGVMLPHTRPRMTLPPHDYGGSRPGGCPTNLSI